MVMPDAHPRSGAPSISKNGHTYNGEQFHKYKDYRRKPCHHTALHRRAAPEMARLKKILEDAKSGWGNLAMPTRPVDPATSVAGPAPARKTTHAGLGDSEHTGLTPLRGVTEIMENVRIQKTNLVTEIFCDDSQPGVRGSSRNIDPDIMLKNRLELARKRNSIL